MCQHQRALPLTFWDGPFWLKKTSCRTLLHSRLGARPSSRQSPSSMMLEAFTSTAKQMAALLGWINCSRAMSRTTPRSLLARRSRPLWLLSCMCAGMPNGSTGTCGLSRTESVTHDDRHIFLSAFASCFNRGLP